MTTLFAAAALILLALVALLYGRNRGKDQRSGRAVLVVSAILFAAGVVLAILFIVQTTST